MSRSFKKPVSGTTSIRRPICCCNHKAMSKWKSDTQRWKRRLNRNYVKIYLMTGNEKYLDFLIDKLSQTSKGDAWNGPHDEKWLCDFSDYEGYMK